MAARTELVEQLSRIDLADTRSGGIHADIEAASTGYPAPVIPITTTANRSTAA